MVDHLAFDLGAVEASITADLDVDPVPLVGDLGVEQLDPRTLAPMSSAAVAGLVGVRAN
jgi:hypothetical protein